MNYIINEKHQDFDNKNNFSVNNKRVYYKRVIKRSTYIYNNYKEIMNKIYFNYNILCKISNKDWEVWAQYLEIFVDEHIYNHNDTYETADSDFE